MSLYNELERTLRSTGYVTGGQASELADAVETLINVREKALHDGLATLQQRLSNLQELLSAVEESTDAIATIEALAAAVQISPLDVESIVAKSKAGQGRVQLVIDNTGGTIHSTISNYPIEIVVVRRDQDEIDDSDDDYKDPQGEPVALHRESADGYGDNEEVEHYFYEVANSR